MRRLSTSARARGGGGDLKRLFGVWDRFGETANFGVGRSDGGECQCAALPDFLDEPSLTFDRGQLA
jgi:hypothetical protein